MVSGMSVQVVVVLLLMLLMSYAVHRTEDEPMSIAKMIFIVVLVDGKFFKLSVSLFRLSFF
jgi:hypothetical protein